MELPVRKLLKNSAKIELDWMHPLEKNAVMTLLNAVIVEGKTYPQQQPLSESEFAAYWLSSDAFVVREIDDTTTSKIKSASGEVVGAFYIRPNFGGRCSHICNSGFIVQPSWRGLGIGRLMGEAMLEIAASIGYQAVMFNLVYASNIPSLNLWQSLGFQTIGRIPKAARIADGLVDALMLYRELNQGQG